MSVSAPVKTCTAAHCECVQDRPVNTWIYPSCVIDVEIGKYRGARRIKDRRNGPVKIHYADGVGYHRVKQPYRLENSTAESCYAVTDQRSAVDQIAVEYGCSRPCRIGTAAGNIHKSVEGYIAAGC